MDSCPCGRRSPPPSACARLVLLDTEAGVPPPEQLASDRGLSDLWLSVGPVDDLVNAVATLIIDDPQENPKWIAKWRALPKESMLQPSDCLFGRDDITARLAEIACPALVVHGTADNTIPMEHAEALAAGLSGCDGVVKVPGAHAANLTHPEPVNAALLAFLQGLPA